MMVWLTDAGSFGIVVAYMLVSVSFLVLRKREPDMERPYKTRSGTFVGVMAVVMSLLMCVLYMPGMPSGLIAQECVIVVGWFLLGVVFVVWAKTKYGKNFGESEGLFYPVKRDKVAR
jgi:amino acid transporter